MATSLRSIATAALLSLLILAPAVVAQEQNLEGILGANVMWTRLADEDALLVGGNASLRIGSRFSIGGFGYGTLKAVRVIEGAIPENLRLGYGGLFVDMDIAEKGTIGLVGGLMLGAGNAQVHAQPIGNQLGSDNFLVVEPRLKLRVPRGGRLYGDLGAGYRLVAGVQDLPHLAPSDLQGLTLTLSVSISNLK